MIDKRPDSLADLARDDYAFPFEVLTPDNGASYFCSGMKLRDYFAARAMQGELASMVDVDNSGDSGLPTTVSDDALANLAKHWYRIADAMLKARKGKA